MGQTKHEVSPRSVAIITSSGCHLCEMAKEVVAAVGLDHELSVRIVDLASPEGQRLAKLHQMPFAPMVLIDGQLHAHGRVSEKKLRRYLQQAPRPINERL